jgi:hypothetical protein
VGLGFVLLPGALSEETSAYIGISQIPIFLAPLIVNFVVRNRRDEAIALQEEEDAAKKEKQELAFGRPAMA